MHYAQPNLTKIWVRLMYKRGSVWLILTVCMLLLLGQAFPNLAASGQQWTYDVSDEWAQGVLQGTAFSDGQIQLENKLELGWQLRQPLRNGQARGLILDPNGNLVIAGHIRPGDLDRIHLLKCTPSGQVIWERVPAPSGRGRAMGVARDVQGNLWEAGFLWNGAQYDYQLAKFDGAGNVLWQRRYASGGDDQAQAIAIDPNGYAIVTGNSSLRGADVRTLKLDAEGRMVWEQRYDGGDGDWAWGVATSIHQEVYVVGSSVVRGQKEGLLIKYNSSGQLLWQQRLNLGGVNVATAVAVSSSGRVAVTGYVERGGNSDMLVLVLDPEGKLLWSHIEDLSPIDRGLGIVWTPQGQLLITGSAQLNGVEATHTLKFDLEGQRLWVRAEPGSQPGRGYAVAADGAGNIYVVGADDTGYATYHYRDGFVPSGSFQTHDHQFAPQTIFTSIVVTAQLYDQELIVIVESSHDRFRTLAGQVRIVMQPGQALYSLRGLTPAAFVRVKFVFTSRSPLQSPTLRAFTILA